MALAPVEAEDDTGAIPVLSGIAGFEILVTSLLSAVAAVDVGVFEVHGGLDFGGEVVNEGLGAADVAESCGFFTPGATVKDGLEFVCKLVYGQELAGVTLYDNLAAPEACNCLDLVSMVVCADLDLVEPEIYVDLDLVGPGVCDCLDFVCVRLCDVLDGATGCELDPPATEAAAEAD